MPTNKQLEAAAAQKARGAELLGEGKPDRALFQYGLVKMNTRELAQQRLVAVGPGPTPAMIAEQSGGVAEAALQGATMGMGAANRGSEEDTVAALELYVAACNNAAHAALKLDRYDAVIDNASEVLHVQPENAKALFRRGKARLMRGRPEEALDDLAAADKHCPGDAGIVDALQQAQAQMAARIGKQRAAMAKMFASEASEAPAGAGESAAPRAGSDSDAAATA
mmetsp:Transcript_34390/g.106245  ORF Transcript_34390/g.106245 Transcript_34390/m.106245 type:complete len:224 (-) Transcript_34390:90-761(-)